MGFHLPLSLILLSLTTLQPFEAVSLVIESGRDLDLVIRDYTFRSYNNNSTRTGEVHKVDLPANLSGLNVNTIKLRCGSLQRYGAKIKEFSLSSGVNVLPCITRVLVVRQSVGSNWSSVYSDGYDLSGYQLISPVLGLQAYSIEGTNRAELQMRAGKSPITVDFTSTALLNTSSKISPLCASFDHDGKVSFLAQARPNVCVAKGNGHFGLVVESPLMPLKKVGKVKIVVVGSIGAALGAFLLSLLVIAMFVNAKKKARMDELERRAYEEEALQVSMVGHVRAVVASGTRTAPRIEHHDQYRIPYS